MSETSGKLILSPSIPVILIRVGYTTTSGNPTRTIFSLLIGVLYLLWSLTTPLFLSVIEMRI
jgi:hypothetical protein